MNLRLIAVCGCAAAFLALPSCNTTQNTPPAKQMPAGPMVFEFNVADPIYKDRLVGGFYPGTEAWQWTGRRFAIRLDAPPPLDQPTFLDMSLAVPVELMAQTKDVTVTARVNGQHAGQATYKKEGTYRFRLQIPAEILARSSPALLEFELDNVGVDHGNNRELGIIVVDVALRHAFETPVSQEASTQFARQAYLDVIRHRKSKLPVETQNQLMRLFHDIPVWRHVWFHNVRIEKNPLDLWMMQQIIYELQPDYIVETGTWMGGSALYWAHTLNGMGLEKSRVITVDLQNVHATAASHPLWEKYVDFFQGSSTDPKIVAEIAARVKGRKTLVALDSDHSMQHVLNELHAFTPMVSRGSYVVVEDSHMDGVPTQPGFGPGPMEAVVRFLKEKEGAEFEQDFSREAMIMTFNPGGWLRRK